MTIPGNCSRCEDYFEDEAICRCCAGFLQKRIRELEARLEKYEPKEQRKPKPYVLQTELPPEAQ